MKFHTNFGREYFTIFQAFDLASGGVKLWLLMR